MAKSCCMALCLFLIAIIFPPLAVLMEDGWGVHFCLNCLLLILFYVPGLLHALWVCFVREPDHYQRSQIIFNV
uniref:UPF0057 membrane protein n=1 Tax=Parastrongyloides trichosuri TaxID=131310 RepID=A0A0N5A578_PARTI